MAPFPGGSCCACQFRGKQRSPAVVPVATITIIIVFIFVIVVFIIVVVVVAVFEVLRVLVQQQLEYFLRYRDLNKSTCRRQ